MPELPELQIIINQLKEELQYAYIDSVVARDASISEDIGLISGQKVIEIVRHDKAIYFQLSRDAFMLSLGENAQLMMSTDNARIAHTRVLFRTTRGDLYLVDKSRMSTVTVVSKDETYVPFAGVDPLTKQFNFKMLYRNLKASKANIGDFLRKEKVVAGLGIRYTGKILRASRLPARHPANRIPRSAAEKLFWNIKNILRDAIIKKSPKALDMLDELDGLYDMGIPAEKAPH
ncbi:MAG: DNA-formamidopyrimidine glycosylase family protein [Spirochaetota bacterium]